MISVNFCTAAGRYCSKCVYCIKLIYENMLPLERPGFLPQLENSGLTSSEESIAFVQFYVDGFIIF